MPASCGSCSRRFGEIGLASYGGVTLGIAYLMLAVAPAWWATPLAVIMIGLGFYMLHNTLQTNATQMAPDARATGVCLFSAALYIGQPVGVSLVAPVIDRFGATARVLHGGHSAAGARPVVRGKARAAQADLRSGDQSKRLALSPVRATPARSRREPGAPPCSADCRRAMP